MIGHPHGGQGVAKRMAESMPQPACTFIVEERHEPAPRASDVMRVHAPRTGNQRARANRAKTLTTFCAVGGGRRRNGWRPPGLR
jgi:hypothetical protein